MPPMPKLTPRPNNNRRSKSPPIELDDDYVSANGAEVNRIYKRNGMNSDDDFVPDNAEYVEL